MSLQAHEVDVYDGMKSLTAYFGEDWDAADPSRVLRVVRDFVNLFNKAHGEIEVQPLLQYRLPFPALQLIQLDQFLCAS